MFDTNRVLLTFYSIYILVFLVILFVSTKLYKGYSISKFWISALGEKSSKSRTLFNFSVIILGLLNTTFVNILSNYLPRTISSAASVVLLYIYSVSILLSGIFTKDSNFKIHNFLSRLLYFSGFFAFITLIKPILMSNDISDWIVILNLLVLTTASIFLYSYTKMLKKLKIVPNTLENYHFTGKILSINNIAVWEWVAFLAILIWHLIVSIPLLQKS